jgi:hypothetical protein
MRGDANMFDEHEPEEQSGGRKYIIWLSVGLGIALLYTGWIFLSRWQDNRAIAEKMTSRRRSAQSADDAAAIAAMGGNNFEILNFYADSESVKRGEDVHLCYSVSNAKSVTLEPQSNPVWPSYGRCVIVNPRKSTTYTLTAMDATGQTKTATVRVEVR